MGVAYTHDCEEIGNKMLANGVVSQGTPSLEERSFENAPTITPNNQQRESELQR